MKKNLWPYMLLLAGIFTGSWGLLGHQTVAAIAEAHLSPEAKQAVSALLGKETLADIANWADEVRPEPAYQHTAPWHYLNVPSGLNYDAFSKAVAGQQTDNIYSAITQCKETLSSKNSTREQKTEALKFIVHLVGDAHQPMHVSHAEDKGGNTIQVRFDGQGTNLHALWDSKLIDHQALSLEQMVKKYDRADKREISQWQNDGIMKWLFESYEISGTLYAETDKEHQLTEDYYTAHIPVVEQRIEKGGIRLAGLLNTLFKNGLAASAQSKVLQATAKTGEQQYPLTPTDELMQHIGQPVTVIDIVADYKVVNAALTLLNIGGRYPDQKLTIAVKGNAIKLNPADLKNKKIRVSGTIALYKDKPEIVVVSPENIQLYKSSTRNPAD